MRKGLSLVGFLLGIFLSLESSIAQAGELKFGFTPVLSPAEMQEEFQPLMDYMNQSIGTKVTLYIAKNYGDLKDQVEGGTVDIGFLQTGSEGSPLISHVPSWRTYTYYSAMER